MLFNLSALTLLAASGAHAAVQCTPAVFGGKLDVVDRASGGATTDLALVDGFLQAAGNGSINVFTLDQCTSTFLGFEPSSVVDGKLHITG